MNKQGQFVTIRPGQIEDCQIIADLIRELNTYEQLEGESLTFEDLERDGFDPFPNFKSIVAELVVEKKIVGYAIYTWRYSTLPFIKGSSTASTNTSGKGIYIEDIFVQENFRHGGIGTKMLKYIAKIAINENFNWISLEVLNSNENSIKFYEKLHGTNSTREDQVSIYKFDKNALLKLAEF